MSSNVQQIVLMKNVIWLFIFVCFGVLAAIAGDFASSMLGVIFGWYIIISVFRIPVSIFKKDGKMCMVTCGCIILRLLFMLDVVFGR